MTEQSITGTEGVVEDGGLKGVVVDWSDDKQAFHVPWGKAMMWIFLLSDTFIFSCFLIGYMNVRITTTVPWPNPSEVFALSLGGAPIPLILIAIMTFVLITSSGTMALAVNYGYRRDKRKTVLLMLATAALGAAFVGMQAFEWTKLIVEEGVRPWGNPMGAAQFGSSEFLHDNRLPRHARFSGRHLPDRRRNAGRDGLLRPPPGRQLRNGRDRRALLAFRRPGMGLYFCIFLSVVTAGDRDDDTSGSDSC
jgi:cytochrome c oxidase subunit 3